MLIFRCFYCKLWTYFTPCSSVSIVNFEQVNASWGCYLRVTIHTYWNNGLNDLKTFSPPEVVQTVHLYSMNARALHPWWYNCNYRDLNRAMIREEGYHLSYIWSWCAEKKKNTSYTEAFFRRCSSKWVLLKISQISREDTRIWAYFK